MQGVGVGINYVGDIVVTSGTNGTAGAGWVFVRNYSTAGLWSQLGTKLLPSDPEIGQVAFGGSACISGDGHYVVIGAAGYNSSRGAVWVFENPVSPTTAAPTTSSPSRTPTTSSPSRTPTTLSSDSAPVFPFRILFGILAGLALVL